jgi:hypothetical protein
VKNTHDPSATRSLNLTVPILGDNGWRWRVLRTSNAYNFRDPGLPDLSKSEKPTGTPIQDFSSDKESDANTPNRRSAPFWKATGIKR